MKTDCRYQVDIYERHGDLRTKAIAKSRTFPIALNDLGMNAVSQAGLKEAVAKISVEMQGTIVHTRNAGTRYIDRKKPLVTLDRSLFVQLIVRQRLAKLLHLFFPKRFLPPLFEALHESSIPYADILREYQSWCNKVKKSRQKFYESSQASRG